MSIFYSAKRNAFFNEILHGARTIQVPDPEWVSPKGQDVNTATAPLIVVPNPVCLLPPENELVQISQEDHDAIFRTLAKGGLVLTSDDKGFPKLTAAPGPTVDELRASERISRDRMLLLTDPLVARHRDELEVGRSTTITAGQYKQLQIYRQALRDWPEVVGFPSIDKRPVTPPWLIEQIK